LKEERVKLGDVWVDAGSLLVVDPCRIGHVDMDEAFEDGQLTDSQGRPGLGVVFPTGFGDGSYEVWATMVDLGLPFGRRVAKVEIQFINPTDPLERFKSS
jgi:hypothetical protein